MSRFKVEIKPSAVKEIEAVPRRKDRQRIVEKIVVSEMILAPWVVASSPETIATGFARASIALCMALKMSD